MRKVLPHEFFRIDFDAMLEAAKRQEEIDSRNTGEYAIAKGIHTYFDRKVLSVIASDNWVFEAAQRFASEFAIDCLKYLRLANSEVYNVRKNLLEMKMRVKELITQASGLGAVKATGTFSLAKASDFYAILDHDLLNKTMRNKAMALYEQAQDEESLLPTVILRAIRDVYEAVLPRIMYVVRRAIKVEMGLVPRKSDERLLGMSKSISFYNDHIDNHHPLYPVLGKLHGFYRVARNAGNHHLGLVWKSDQNEVVLQGSQSSPLTVPLLEFQQRYRYFIYLSEFLDVRSNLDIKSKIWYPHLYGQRERSW
jgi:hypothetical protein